VVELRAHEGVGEAAQGLEGEPIAHLVADARRGGRDGLEAVLVDPAGEGAGDLLVDEADAGLPGGDAGLPAEGDPVEPQPVVDPRAGPHRDRQRGHEREAQLGRRDRLEVRGVGEEREDRVEGQIEEELAAQQVGRFAGHVASGGSGETTLGIRRGASSAVGGGERHGAGPSRAAAQAGSGKAMERDPVERTAAASSDEPVWRRWHDERQPVRLGVSACLLGAEVRFDGSHKRDRYLTDVLGASVTWLPVCPELELGMGVPRPVIQLRGGEVGDRLVVREDGRDLTDAMRAFSDGRTAELAAAGLDGYVLKKDSPSCGLQRVRVHGAPGGMPQRTGVGHFAQALARAFPGLPLEEEGRLNDPPLRERFIEAIFSRNRWRVLVARGVTRPALVAFHEAHKMLLLAHDERLYRALGRLVGSFGRIPDDAIVARYAEGFAAAFARPATVARHVNVLEHLFGHLKRRLSKTEKREIGAAIGEYRAGRVPLVVPVSLLRFLVAAHEADWVRGQLYLEPHPKELMLRNHV